MFSFREEKNVRLFDVMTKTSASSDKNVHLTKNKCQQLTVLMNIYCVLNDQTATIAQYRGELRIWALNHELGQ